MAPLEGLVGVGALFDAIMSGCLIVQSCVYYKNSRGDAWLSRILVLLILFLLFSQLGCTAAWLWASTEGYTGDGSLPDCATILFGVSSVCGAVISFLSRCFFSHRIMKLSNSHLLAFLFFVLCIFSFTAALGAATVFFTHATADLTSQLSNSWIFPLVLISGLTCDLAINFVTGFYLRSQALAEVAFDVGRGSRLLSMVAETGIMTSVFGITVVVVYWLTKTQFAWLALIVLMPGVFANTCLAALNAREQLCTEIKHQRVGKIGDKLIEERAKRPPILIAISKQVVKQSEKNPV